MKSSVVRAFGLFASVLLAGVAGAQSTQPVEWKVSEGGNGHWYALIDTGLNSWTLQRDFALNLHGHLATTTTEAELNFVRALIPLNIPGYGQNYVAGPAIGLYQVAGSVEPSGGWVWVTGESLLVSDWTPGEPNNSGGVENCARYRYQGGVLSWNDWLDGFDSIEIHFNPLVTFALIEWDADCNGDGIVDYGQILRGELDDDNANGIPDVCETSVTGVIPPSVPSQGGSTVTIKGANFPDHPTVLIGGVAATDVVRLSATRITATSPALLPGMASISVNGFTLPEALYIRPECGSDLDQNGTVDTGDISIILLDFGPCYEPPSTIAAPAPTPLLLPDATSPVPTPPAPQSAHPAPQPRERSS